MMIYIRHPRNVLVTSCTGCPLHAYVLQQKYLHNCILSLGNNKNSKQQEQEALGMILVFSTILQIQKLQCS